MTDREPEDNAQHAVTTGTMAGSRRAGIPDTLKICIVYIVFSILWILFYDRLFLSPDLPPDGIFLLSFLKGIFFIIVTTTLLYLLIRGLIDELRETRRKLAEEGRELEKSREQEVQSRDMFRTLFDSAGDAIFIMEQGVVLDCNRATEQIFRCSRGDIIGRSIPDLSPERQPDGRLSRESAEENMNTARDGGPLHFPWEHRRPDGSSFPAEITLNRFVMEGKEYRQAIVRDVTATRNIEDELRASYEQIAASEEELRGQFEALVMNERQIRESEERFRQLVSMGPFICVVNDMEGRYSFVNRTFEENSGYIAAEVIGRTSAELGLIGHDDFRTMVRELEKSGHLEGFESVIRTRDGTVRHILTSSRFITFDNRPQVISAILDITERTRSQEALALAKKKLNLLNSVTFTDIQNMIFTLSGYQQLVQDRITDSTARDLAGKGSEILHKISLSLKFAQGYQDLGLRPSRWQDVSQVFLLAISHLDFIRIRHAEQLDGLEIFADPKLEQVFLALADNTLVHGKTATEVNLRFRKGPDSLVIVYEDNGTGIPAEMKERIFAPEFQKIRSPGLFLAREILEITGITMRETGEPGGGARFELTVPRGMYRFAGH